MAFFATLVLLPVRLRIDLLPRPDPPVQRGYTDFLLFAPDIAMLATLVLWSLSLLATRRRPQLGPPYFWAPQAGLSAAGWLSIAASVDRALSLYHAIRLLALFLLFMYVVTEVAASALLITAVALQGIVQSVVAVAQFLSQRSIGLRVLGESPLNPAWSGISIVSVGADRVLRAYGLSDHPNILGGCLACGLLLLMAAYLWAGWESRFKLAIAFLPMSLALLLTFSRSAWLAFLAGAALLVAIQLAAHRGHSIKALLWLVLATTITLAPFVWKNAGLLGIRLGAHGSLRSVPTEEQSVGERLLLMQMGSQVFASRPLTGVGLGASPVALRNAYPQLTMAPQPPHLAFLDAALETGLPGAAFYFLLMVLPWAALARHKHLLFHPQVAGAAAFLMSVTVIGFFDHYTWSLVPGRLLQWLAWGFLASTLRTVSEATIPVAAPAAA